MEKFSKFTDKGTGIGPFKPTTQQVTLVSFLGLVPIFCVKMILFVPFWAFLMLSYPFNGLYKIFLDIILAYFYQVDVEVSVDGVRRSNVAKVEASKPQKGQVAVVNAISPLDYQIWQCISQCPIAVAVANNDGLFLVPGASDYKKWCFQGSVEIPSTWSRIESVDEQFKNKCLFIVLEGTITNNRGILQQPKGFVIKDYLGEESKVRVISMKMTPVGNIGTVLPINEWWWNFVNFGNTKTHKLKMVISEAAKNDAVELRQKLTVNRLKLLSLDIDSKRDFITAFKEKKYI